MKKNLLSGLAVLLILVGACSSTPEEVKSDVERRRDFPTWFLVPPSSDDMIYGLGMAKMSSDTLSRDTAIARARRDVATQVSTRVQTVMADYAQEAGVDGDRQSISFIETVSKQVADVQLRNAITKEVYPATDGTWYAMVAYSRSEFQDTVAQIFQRNESAAFAEFKADEAMRMLEGSVNQSPMRSNPTN